MISIPSLHRERMRKKRESKQERERKVTVTLTPSPQEGWFFIRLWLFVPYEPSVLTSSA